jgi:hypothetical protein
MELNLLHTQDCFWFLLVLSAVSLPASTTLRARAEHRP